MTDIGVFSLPYQTEDRSWLLNTNNIDDVYTLSATLQISAFTQAVHFPNGYIPSGTVLGAITAASTGGALVVGPYDATATDGRQTAVGFLFSSARAWNPLGAALSKVGVGCAVAFGVINTNRLPFNATNAATGRGYLDPAAKTALPLFYYAAV